MFETLKQILIVNAYWFSLPLSGYGLLLALKERPRLRAAGKRALEFALEQPFIGIAFISCAFTTMLLAIFSLFCYLVHAPVALMSAFYVLTVGCGMGYLLMTVCKSLFKKPTIRLPELRNQTLLTKLVFLLMVLVLTIDFLFGLYVKSYALRGGDTYVHLARMVTILARGFTVNSGYFGNLPEVGYHYNAIYALYVVQAQLFHIQPSVIWEYSFGFFRLLEWAAIFTLAWHVCSVWLRDKVNALLVSSLATIFAVAYYGAVFFIAVYPDQLVDAWLVLLVLGVSFYETKPRASFLPAALTAFLITMTHPTYAFMSAGFLGLAGLIKLCLVWKDKSEVKRSLLFYGSLVVLLMLSPLRTELYPQRTGANTVTVGNFPTIKLGSLSIKHPVFFWHNPLSVALLLAVGVFGLWFVLYKLRKARQQWPIVLSLLLFFPLIAYFPLVFSLLSAILPLWVIGRFSAMNVLGYVAIIFGLYGLLYTLGSWEVIHNRLPKWLGNAKAATLVGVVVVLGLSAHYISPTYHTLTPSRQDNEAYYGFMAQIYNDFHTVLGGEKTVVASIGDSYLLPAVLPVHVIAIETGHTTPAADAPDRQACQRQLMEHFNYADLKTVNASYVVIATHDPAYKAEKGIIDSAPYLHPIAEDQDFDVYSFNKNQDIQSGVPYRPCVKYQQVEAS